MTMHSFHALPLFLRVACLQLVLGVATRRSTLPTWWQTLGQDQLAQARRPHCPTNINKKATTFADMTVTRWTFRNLRCVRWQAIHSNVLTALSPQQPRDIVAPAGAGGDEASALAAMFAASNEQWQQTQTQMSK